jgi:hypothetical protein
LLRRKYRLSPLGFLLEGGYDLAGLEGALGASLGALVDDESPHTVAGRVGATHTQEIARASSALRQTWQLG